MEESLKKMQEDGRRKLQELNEKQSMRFVVSKLKFKKFEKIKLNLKLISLMFGASFVTLGADRILNNNDSTIVLYDNIDSVNNLEDAQDEVIVGYINNSFSKFSDYLNEGGIYIAQDQIEAVRSSYFSPALEAYDNYKETNDDKYHDEFIKNAKEYEKRISDYSSNFTFSNSDYKYAKYKDGKIYLPYMDTINGVLPDNYYIHNNIVYVPEDNISDVSKKSK